jgi:hypothetical protein
MYMIAGHDASVAVPYLIQAAGRIRADQPAVSRDPFTLLALRFTFPTVHLNPPCTTL